MRVRNLAAVVVPLVLVAGCAGGGSGGSATTSPPAVSASPSLDKKALIAEGTEAIRAFRQTVFDIYADPVPDVNALKRVMAPGESLTENLKGIRKSLAQGWTSNSGEIKITWVKPVSLKPEMMTLYACVDPNGMKLTRKARDGKVYRFVGGVWGKTALEYVLVPMSGQWVVLSSDTRNHAKKAPSC